MPAMSGPTSRRRLSTDQRRAEILAAAAAEFARADYAEVSTTRLAAASGSSQALLFHYFGTKAGLFAAVVQEAVNQLRLAQEAADQALPEGVSARDRVRASIERFLKRANSKLERWETVKTFAILDHELTVADGAVTPNMKMRRRQVVEAHREIVDSLFVADPGAADE